MIHSRPSGERLEELFDDALGRGLDLDMTRGKPSSEQLDLSAELLGALGTHFSEDGIDCRNYGAGDGLAGSRRLYADYLGVDVEELVLGDNASLSLMHDALLQAILKGVPGGSEAWIESRPLRFLCPCPGYDRHFAICEYLGIEMIPVPMTDVGPDLDVVRDLCPSDAAIKGMFCVPRYSNPTGITYSADTVRALAEMETAAPDFRIIWDNAYAVHHLYSDPAPLTCILTECRRAGHPDRPLIFGSTSKITLAGAGLSMMGGSAANATAYRLFRSKKTIGPDKLNQLRHLRFLPDMASIHRHMEKHADILRPKFEAVLEILDEQLGGLDLATWTRPRGGYFISVDTHDGCARRVIELAAQAGVRLTPAGATFPYGKDPRDRNIRLAPSYPPLDEVREATHVLALAIQLVSGPTGRASSAPRP